MTGLGASIYLGFFVLAAVWLFLTSDGPLIGGDDQSQRPERSTSTNTDANSEESSPWLVSHSQK
jgi:hypothetical protein